MCKNDYDIPGLFGITFVHLYWFSDVPHGAGSGAEGGGVPAQEEGEDDISGTQFVCETVIRSMTLEEAPDHTPLRASRPGTGNCGLFSFLYVVAPLVCVLTKLFGICLVYFIYLLWIL